MAALILHRLLQAAGVLLIVALLAFTMFRFVGDPVNQMVGLDTSPAERAALRERLGLNEPILMQFWSYLGNILSLDFGLSYQFKQPVIELLASRLPATLELAAVAAALALLVGVPLGVLTATHARSRWARACLAVSLLGVAVPTFVIGILLIFIGSVQLGWLPSFGRGATVELGFWTTGLLTGSGRRALVLPALTLSLLPTALLLRMVRAQMLQVLRSGPIRHARARGLPDRSVIMRHALRNAAVPVVTVAGLQLGSLIAFGIITESVFQWPGTGLLFLQAVQNVDMPIMAAYLLATGCLFVMINLAVDLACVAIDPRLRRPASAAAS